MGRSRAVGALTASRRAFAVFRYRPLVAVLGIGLAIRVFTMLVYDRAVFSYYGGDSARYLRLYTDAGLFGDGFMPAGYPAFLRGLLGSGPRCRSRSVFST